MLLVLLISRLLCRQGNMSELKHSLSHTLSFRKDQQYNLQETSVTAPCTAPRSSSGSFSLPSPFSLPARLTLSSHPPHFCLIASAPPYNHAGSWLSFGAVYIAVIVRVQCRDWAEHVYSFTGQLRNKSGSGEERIGVGGAVLLVHTIPCAHAHIQTLSLAHNAKTTW